MTCASCSWISILTALLTPLLAIFALYIALRQWQTARNRLKLDLFSRRLEIFEAAHRFLAEVNNLGNIPGNSDRTFLQETRSARWLFSLQFQRYLDEAIYKPAIELRMLNTVLPGLTNQVHRAANAARQVEIMKHLQEAHAEIDKRGQQFMQLTHA